MHTLPPVDGASSEHAGHARPPAGLSPSGVSRRRFAARVGGTGVILTLVSQPGMAAGPTMCKSASGSMSNGITSRAPLTPLVCAGLSPGYWRKPDRPWPNGVDKNALFASVFPNGFSDFQRSKGTLLSIMSTTDNQEDPFNLGTQLVATYLNVLDKKISFLTVDGLKLMWHDLVYYGYYSPTANVKWGPEDVKNYLEKTHDS